MNRDSLKTLRAGLGALSLVGALCLCSTTAWSQAVDGQVKPHAGMLRYPDVSQSHIVFSYANDLWLVPREGGRAVPLASPPGTETYPRFDDSGKVIAFQGNYEGNRDLYTIGIGGGVANRVTYHPTSETLCGWTPGGELLFFSSGRSQFPKTQQLLTIPASGGMSQPLPIPYGANGAISADGEWLAYTPHARDTRTWKRYRGGMASDIWLFNLNDLSSRKVTEWEGTDSLPMWHDRTLYYVSDQGPEHRLNIWKYDLRSGRRSQVTGFKEYDIKWPSIGPGANGKGEIVFQHGSELRLLDLESEKSRVVEVEIPGERTYLRPKMVDAKNYIQSWHLSPSGKRAVVQARGDIWTLPAKNGSPRNLTRTSGVAERSPAWSPDGRWIAYFGDETGEYELYVVQSDGKGETRQLTDKGGAFKTAISWSPDSKHLLFSDKTSALYHHDLDNKETKLVDQSPWGFVGNGTSPPSWSHDSGWVAYSRATNEGLSTAVFLYELESGKAQQVTSGMFADSNPTFDKKGEWLYYSSNRRFTPTYSDLDTTFIYRDSEVLMATPLREDVEAPWQLESDEEGWEEEEEETEEEEEGDSEESEEESEEASEEADEEPQEETVDDGLSGTWEGKLSGSDIPGGEVDMTVEVQLAADGSMSGSIVVPMGTATIIAGTYDKGSGSLEITIETDEGLTVQITGKVSGDKMTGSGTIPGPGIGFDFELTRTSTGGGQDGDADSDEEEADKAEEAEKLVIELEGLEHRAILLPVRAGNFGRLAVNDKNQLLYARIVSGGAGSSGIKLFDLKDDKKSEKSVVSGATNFRITSDGKKLLVVRGSSASIQGTGAGGGKSQNVQTAGMNVTIHPREEWRQLFTDAWRIERDYFYDPTMHGVDWKKVHEQYMAMIDDCSSREDVAFVLGEMISELNVGHAYLMGAGDVESQPSVGVGMLGCDYTLNEGAYQITKIYEGAAWDADARGPLSQLGVDVDEGDYLLAVNGIPVDTAKDPWAAFQGLANRVITITVSEKPTLDDEARDVILKPISSEYNLRFRAWIEKNRAYVAEKTGGRAGYIYVTDTGQTGQNDLFRQFMGQFHKPALVIDERWNGGGQIPTRFIELLNRPVTNYWAGRDGKDWHWPPDSHQGPKCMLINGMAGSGGDAFPAYFRQAGLGKLIGMRTWGGLVGISGNPRLIDNGMVSAPTFAYYDTDGTWGIEGHGVDPDIEVVDNPSQMAEGADPQLDMAIKHIVSELKRIPYLPPARPRYPDRSGMGIAESDK